MRVLLQRVRQARVRLVEKAVDDSASYCPPAIAEIGPGLLVFAAWLADDTPARIERMAERVLTYRVFADQQGKMNLNVQQVKGELLVVSQFTLAANTHKGNRPSFAPAMPPELAHDAYQIFLNHLHERYPNQVAHGQFQADMQVELINDGPVTFWLES